MADFFAFLLDFLAFVFAGDAAAAAGDLAGVGSAAWAITLRPNTAANMRMNFVISCFSKELILGFEFIFRFLLPQKTKFSHSRDCIDLLRRSARRTTEPGNRFEVGGIVLTQLNPEKKRKFRKILRFLAECVVRDGVQTCWWILIRENITTNEQEFTRIDPANSRSFAACAVP